MERSVFLRGMGGATLALPFLEIFGKRAQAQPAGASRLLICYAGQAMGGDGDTSPHRFRPATEGKLRGMALPLSLQPLGGLANWSGRYKHPRFGDFVEPIRNWPGEVADVRDLVSVVTGLKIPHQQGAASANTYHHRGTVSPQLSGTSSKDASPVCHGETADVIARKKFASPASLHCLVQAGNYGNGGSNDGAMSWQTTNAGNLEPVGAQVSPQAMFTSLFEGFKPDPSTVDTAAQQRAALRRRSVLDLVLPSAQRLNGRLGVEDKRRLAAHLDGISTLRSRVLALQPSTGAQVACQAPKNPGADPRVAGGTGGDGGGFSAGQGWSDEDKRATAFIDIVTTAMACNLTRTGTLMFSYTQSFLNGENPTGLRGDQHQIGHGGPVERANDSPNDSVALCHHYPVRYFGYLVGKMAGITMAPGRTLLDECATGLFFEAGHGQYEGRMNAHSGEEMACLVAGSTMKDGEHIRLPGEHPARVLATMMSAVGCDARLGEIQGANPRLTR